MTYNYYMTPVERQRYEQQKLFDTLAQIGMKDPAYALGLALGRGAADAYGNNMTARQENKLDAFVNEQLSPSTKVQIQDEALKQMLQPDAQKEMISLANTQPRTMQPIGETKYIQTPQQQGFSAPSQAAIREFARNNGVGNNVVNNRMANYQEQIKERAREYYVPKIGALVENGALTNNAGLAQLASELGQYGQYDPTGAKNISATLGGMMKPTVINRTATSGTNLMNGSMGGGNTKSTQQSSSYSLKHSDLKDYINQRQNIINSVDSTEEEIATAKDEMKKAMAIQNRMVLGEEPQQPSEDNIISLDHIPQLSPDQQRIQELEKELETMKGTNQKATSGNQQAQKPLAEPNRFSDQMYAAWSKEKAGGGTDDTFRQKMVSQLVNMNGYSQGDAEEAVNNWLNGVNVDGKYQNEYKQSNMTFGEFLRTPISKLV